MDNSQVMGMIALIVSIGGVFIGILNHKKIRSNCCGRRLEASIDIDNTTPTKNNSLSLELPYERQRRASFCRQTPEQEASKGGV